MIEKILCTMVIDVDAKQISKLSYVEFAINLSVKGSIGKIAFELVYGQQVRNVVNQLDGLHHIEGAQQMINNISKLVEEAKLKLL